ncbi:MAG: M13 family metallopeptidase [Xanthomonadales bacterium]|nr:M13 family metallopeptidase [Xanthomonadales bacterium]
MTRPRQRLLAASLATLLLTACGSDNGSSPITAENAAANNPAINEPPPSPAMHSGLDMAGIDTATAPGDDFEQYANGHWRQVTEIPADRSSTGVFYEVFKKAEKRTSDLIRKVADKENEPGSNARKIADFYQAWMDEDAIEAHGLTPLQPDLDAIAAVSDRQQLATLLGDGLRADVDPLNATDYNTSRPFGLFVTQALDDPSTHRAYLLQGGLGLPDRDYYLSDDADMVELRGKYQDYAAKLLATAGDANAADEATKIMALETSIAQVHANIVDSMDVEKANTVWARKDFGKKAPGLDWDSYFKAAGLDDQDSIDVWQVDAIRGIAGILGKADLGDIKAWLRFHALNRSAALLPKAFANLQFDFYGRTLQGTPEQRDRWKRAVAATNGALGDAVGQLYVERYFPPESKATIEQLVNNINGAFLDRVDQLLWMTAETRAEAKRKAAAVKVGVGYPDRWRDYSQLDIRPDDALGNALRAEHYEFEHQRDKLKRAPDRGEWWMTPQTVNAVNLPVQNAMNFPAAILEPPFFDPKADPAANYGAIGAVIGHEISHSFDNLGSAFDAEGRLRNWWTPEDEAQFDAAAQMLVEQFDGYEALPGLHVKGQQTLGENIADVSGLTIAYMAYHKSLGDQPAPEIDGLSGDQRFFLAFAQVWRGKVRDAALRQQVNTNAHAPGRFRAETVRNIDAWYAAYDVQPDQGLYLAPDERVHIW